MANPILQAMGGGGSPMLPGPMGNMAQMMQAFNQFKENFKGDPKQKVQEMLNSGQVTQSQVDQAMQMAKQFQAMMPK